MTVATAELDSRGVEAGLAREPADPAVVAGLLPRHDPGLSPVGEAFEPRSGSLGNTRVTVHGVRWQTYESLAADPAFARVRLTFLDGDLEIMTVSAYHEKITCVLARLVEHMTLLLLVPLESYGGMTFTLIARRLALEPDKCYYVARAEAMRNRQQIDLSASDPPPDLVIETDIRNSTVRKEAIYSAMGVPELWRYDARTGAVEFRRLGPDGQYAPVTRSVSFPFLASADFGPFLARLGEGEQAVVRAFGEFALSELAARRAREETPS